MADFVRSFNPIWSIVDLTGSPADDTYYIFFLQNTLPYLPAAIFQDDQGNTPRANPVQLLANGTMPVDVFLDPDVIYRIEVREGNSSSDPLIYLIENYIPAGSGSVEPTQIQAVSENQITNPEWADIAFTEIDASSDNAIDLGGGWEFIGTGGGTVTITRTANTGANDIPTQPAYVLNVTTSGKASAQLRQRFVNNSGLFQSASDTDSALAVSLVAQDNLGATSVPLNITWAPSSGVSTAFPSQNYPASYALVQTNKAIPISTNTDNSDVAYVDFLISVPASGNISITSIQLVKTITPQNVAYKQESVERQRDHTFHYYRDSILLQPKESVLTGWDFALNPYQFTPKSSTTMTVSTSYQGDQTILHQQGDVDSVAVKQAGFADNLGYAVEAKKAANRVALIQYIDPKTIQSHWGGKLSALLTGRIKTSNSTNVRIKMRLISRETLPSEISATEPVASWSGDGDPNFGTGWTAITPKNDPIYTLTNTTQTIGFDAFELPAMAAATQTLGVVVYIIDNMVETGTPDELILNRVSLVPNDFAIDANPLSFDETLKRCRFYYEKSYALGALPGVVDGQGRVVTLADFPHIDSGGLNAYLVKHRFAFYFKATKRAIPVLKNITLYSPTAATKNRLFIGAWNANTLPAAAVGTNPSILETQSDGGTATPDYVFLNASEDMASYYPRVEGTIASFSATLSPAFEGTTEFHYIIDVRLGAILP